MILAMAGEDYFLPSIKAILLLNSSRHQAQVTAFLKFLAIGTFFSTVEEFLTIAVLKHDLASYVFTLLVVFPTFLTGVWFSSRLIERFVQREPVQELVHFFVFGAVGLLCEWFIMGLAPWSDPDANPLVMFIFQLGMFSFWATVAFAPRLFTNPSELSQRTGRAMLRFFIPYFSVVYLVCFLLPVQSQFVTTIALILFGYLALNLFYVRYFLRAIACRPVLRPLS